MQNVSNVINLFADAASCDTRGNPHSAHATGKPANIDTHWCNRPRVAASIEPGPARRSITVSTVPQSRLERETMVEIEERLYRYPAIAQATAFRYESGNGNIGYGAAVVLFDWIDKVTVADIKKWIVAHLDFVTLPIEIVKVEAGLFAK
jgi:hypothetical protein